MTELLVTGGAGFIGCNFVRHRLRTHPDERLIVVDALTYAGTRTSLDGLRNVDLVVADIADTERMIRLLVERDVPRIVHFAAETHVDRSISGPDAFVATNVVGTHSLLKAAKAAWLDRGSGRPHRFHNVSTDEVYGSLGPTDPAFRETTAYAPNSPYAASKAGADHLVRAYHHTYGLDVTVSHCSNNYGPYQFPEKLIPLFLINALSGRALPIYGDGLNVRDWLHVEDHCRGVSLAIGHGVAGEVYNIGGGEEFTNLSVAHELCRAIDVAFGKDPALALKFGDAPAAHGVPSATLIAHVEDRAGHDRRYAVDETKARRDLGYAPRRTFSEGLADTVAWYLANDTWWRSLMERSLPR